MRAESNLESRVSTCFVKLFKICITCAEESCVLPHTPSMPSSLTDFQIDVEFSKRRVASGKLGMCAECLKSESLLSRFFAYVCKYPKLLTCLVRSPSKLSTLMEWSNVVCMYDCIERCRDCPRQGRRSGRLRRIQVPGRQGRSRRRRRICPRQSRPGHGLCRKQGRGRQVGRFRHRGSRQGQSRRGHRCRTRQGRPDRELLRRQVGADEANYRGFHRNRSGQGFGCRWRCPEQGRRRGGLYQGLCKLCFPNGCRESHPGQGCRRECPPAGRFCQLFRLHHHSCFNLLPNPSPEVLILICEIWIGVESEVNVWVSVRHFLYVGLNFECNPNGYPEG